MNREFKQHINMGSLQIDTQVREYVPKDYEDVDEKFICEWLLRRFAGLNVALEARDMLYAWAADSVGHMKKFPTYTEASKALGIVDSTFRVSRHRLLEAGK